jgi:hypothetical protein
MKRESQAGCAMPVIPVLRKLSQEDDEFNVSLGYVARSSLSPYSTAF